VSHANDDFSVRTAQTRILSNATQDVDNVNDKLRDTPSSMAGDIIDSSGYQSTRNRLFIVFPCRPAQSASDAFNAFVPSIWFVFYSNSQKFNKHRNFMITLKADINFRH